MRALRRTTLLVLCLIASFTASAASSSAGVVAGTWFNQGGCRGIVDVHTPAWFVVAGGVNVTCDGRGPYSVDLQTGWTGFSSIYSSAQATRSGAFSQLSLNTDRNGMLWGRGVVYWACVSVYRNGPRVTNSCAFYRT